MKITRILTILLIAFALSGMSQTAHAASGVTMRDPAGDWFKRWRPHHEPVRPLRSIDILKVTASTSGTGASKRVRVVIRARNVWSNTKNHKQGFWTFFSATRQGRAQVIVGPRRNWSGPEMQGRNCTVKQTKHVRKNLVVHSFPLRCLPRGMRGGFHVRVHSHYKWYGVEALGIDRENFSWDITGTSKAVNP